MPTLVNVAANKENEAPPDSGLESWRKSHGIVDNRPLALSRQQQQVDRFLGNYPLYTNDNMGIQSQNCNGSVKKMKKQGSKIRSKAKFKLSRMNVSGSSPYVPSLNCRLCAIHRMPEGPKKEKEKKAYHQGHHLLCPQRGANKRKATIQTNTMRNYIDGATKRVTSDPARAAPTAVPPVNIVAGSVGYNIQHLQSMAVDSDFVSDMKLEIDDRMEKLEKTGEPKWASGKQAPPVVILAVELLLLQFQHSRRKSTDSVLPVSKKFREAYETYSSFFPTGTATFTFPEDTTGKPSPAYHCLAGQQIIYLDWQLAFPATPLLCPKCRGFLTHMQTNFRKNQGSLFPVWNQDGSIIWCVIMKYMCSKCKHTVDANDGSLLQLLPAHMAAAYPVPPRYATKDGGFHLHKDAIRFFEFMLKTYCNGDQCSVFLVRSQASRFLEKARTYLSQSPSKPFPNFYEFINKKWPPSGSNIRRLYESAEYSGLTPYEYSNYQRYNQEIRTVEFQEGDTAAFDHTFAATRSYKDKSSIGMKCIADLNNGRTGEIAGVWCVPSTKLKEVSHALTQAKWRLKEVSVITTDTMPHGLVFWKATLGEDIIGRLGLFHFLQRIIDTLDPHCEYFWECLLKLKDSIYRFNSDDWTKLVEALGNGSLGEKLNEDEIAELRKSKTFKQRYDKFLRKVFHSEEVVTQYLIEWMQEWENVTDCSDRKVFTYRTVDVTKEQLKKVKYVLDCQRASNYEALPSKGDHGLTEWRCHRAEPGLEYFHQQLAHYTNIGCKEEYANVVILRGVAEHNVAARWRYSCKTKRRQGEVLAHPEYMDAKPIFMNHSLVDHVNRLSRDKGFGDLVQDCRVPKVGNEKEEFLTTYCRAQNERNEEDGIVADSGVCLCVDCKDKYELPQNVARGTTQRRRPAPATAPADAPTEATAPQQRNPPQDPNLVCQPIVNQDSYSSVPPRPAYVPSPAPLMHPMTQHVPVCNPYNYPMNPINFFPARPITNPRVLRDCCFLSPPFWCQAFRNRKSNLGRPPHDQYCPKKMGFDYSKHI